jgi:HEAT repeat protein
MNTLLQKLSGGNLLSDGDSKKVAQEVLDNPGKFANLKECLSEKDDVVRARACDAIEFISRYKPELIEGIIQQLTELATCDPVDMVRWHCAMIFANLSYDKQSLEKVVSVLYEMLKDESNMVKPWAISTLAILGKRHPETKLKTLSKLKPLLKSGKPSVANRSKKAMTALIDNQPLPAGWKKTAQL